MVVMQQPRLRGEMLHDDDGVREAVGQAIEKGLNGLQPAGGGADTDDLEIGESSSRGAGAVARRRTSGPLGGALR